MGGLPFRISSIDWRACFWTAKEGIPLEPEPPDGLWLNLGIIGAGTNMSASYRCAFYWLCYLKKDVALKPDIIGCTAFCRLSPLSPDISDIPLPGNCGAWDFSIFYRRMSAALLVFETVSWFYKVCFMLNCFWGKAALVTFGLLLPPLFERTMDRRLARLLLTSGLCTVGDYLIGNGGTYTWFFLSSRGFKRFMRSFALVFSFCYWGLNVYIGLIFRSCLLVTGTIVGAATGLGG